MDVFVNELAEEASVALLLTLTGKETIPEF